MKYRMILKTTLKAQTGFEYRLAFSRTAAVFSLKQRQTKETESHSPVCASSGCQSVFCFSKCSRDRKSLTCAGDASESLGTTATKSNLELEKKKSLNCCCWRQNQPEKGATCLYFENITIPSFSNQQQLPVIEQPARNVRQTFQLSQ